MVHKFLNFFKTAVFEFLDTENIVYVKSSTRVTNGVYHSIPIFFIGPESENLLTEHLIDNAKQLVNSIKNNIDNKETAVYFFDFGFNAHEIIDTIMDHKTLKFMIDYDLIPIEDQRISPIKFIQPLNIHNERH